MSNLLVFKPNITPGDMNPHFYPDFATFFDAPYAFAYEDSCFYYALSEQCPFNHLAIEEQKSKYTTLEDWIKNKFKATDIRPSLNQAGKFYKRMWHPSDYLSPALLISNPESYTQSLVVIELLIKKMNELFLTIEPTEKNVHVFGLKIRELLLLACMEVEASWKGVLKEHEYIKNSKQPWNTTDYIKLLEPMCLANYTLALRSYPNFPHFQAFSCWSQDQPTKSLYWYNAYNNTKHDREASLHEATLLHAIHSVGAVVVMFCAQFGIPQKQSLFDIVISTFDISLKPCPERFYIPFNTNRDTANPDFSNSKYCFR